MSRVLSNPNVVSIKTRLKVLKAVDVLGYIPNSTAKNLRRSRTGKLLVTVPDISNPFFSLILQGIEDAAQREDYAVLVGDTQHDERREQRYALMLNSKEADGLIFLGHRLPEAAAALARSAGPHCAPIVNGCEFNPRLGIPIHSLYGAYRKPTPEMLSDVDILFCDLCDVGSRIYTFIYTMALAMQACAETGKKMVILDRPNPIAGQQVEGNVLGYDSERLDAILGGNFVRLFRRGLAA